MILPIVAYGDPVLKKKAVDLDKDYPKLNELIANMWDTMYNASGVGLAAPQIGASLRLFVADTSGFVDEAMTAEEKKQLNDFKKVFINPQIIEEMGKDWSFNEGCLSIPDIREEVIRKDTLTIQYLDEQWVSCTETYDGLLARVIQHEYDHIEGILFTDKLSTLKKRLIKGRLDKISKGKIEVDYKMKFPNISKKR